MKRSKFFVSLGIAIAAVGLIVSGGISEEKKSALVAKIECDRGNTDIIRIIDENGTTFMIRADSGNIYRAITTTNDVSTKTRYFFYQKGYAMDVNIPFGEWMEKLAADCPDYHKYIQKKENDCRIISE
ncbi:hypothetical protein A2303_06675 [Candidatus Falkowbacteria bacterium RIFOXYB2_FULL_47_14]|uniref:Uncharacterized protein n=1 Tax=Candidatus Falkowbacteria bacterium RIFOXYA2_FULL_47_19 TaxID=1797994 RepID=A0A1F5SG29_9BACT|nr:MAG: hypothetical protein A2227_00420 [Candidatus Falkowbacteria bacterium RIFOXYA2_FULL_47_19]OGF35534.1 MAG: hypothetical protein A2468_05855 [Candidatus Falkowbacteria bacterium RIFOXYC2_FULL_46_15]OGF43557.1 MAG: hypothetical protein A2303_06675 [Candidatus Falkowbacteria bacterium RIFOXYB2_FULL_47_14]